MEFTPQETRMVEVLRRKQRIFRGNWRWLRWLMVAMGVFLICAPIWLANQMATELSAFPRVSEKAYRDHLNSLNPDERLKELETNVSALQVNESDAARLFARVVIRGWEFITCFIGVANLVGASMLWRGNPTETLLLKLIDEQAKPAQKPPV